MPTLNAHLLEVFLCNLLNGPEESNQSRQRFTTGKRLDKYIRKRGKPYWIVSNPSDKNLNSE
jgi:hypothetical protein